MKGTETQNIEHKEALGVYLYTRAGVGCWVFL